jgi:hypothetical protein
MVDIDHETNYVAERAQKVKEDIREHRTFHKDQAVHEDDDKWIVSKAFHSKMPDIVKKVLRDEAKVYLPDSKKEEIEGSMTTPVVIWKQDTKTDVDEIIDGAHHTILGYSDRLAVYPNKYYYIESQKCGEHNIIKTDEIEIKDGYDVCHIDGESLYTYSKEEVEELLEDAIWKKELNTSVDEQVSLLFKDKQVNLILGDREVRIIAHLSL